MPYRDNPHLESENVMSLKFLELFKRNEHTEEYHIRGPLDKISHLIPSKSTYHIIYNSMSFNRGSYLLNYPLKIKIKKIKTHSKKKSKKSLVLQSSSTCRK